MAVLLGGREKEEAIHVEGEASVAPHDASTGQRQLQGAAEETSAALVDVVKEEEEEDEDQSSILGLRSHWDATYAEELKTFHELGEPGEIWFGADVNTTAAEWTARLAATSAAGMLPKDLPGEDEPLVRELQEGGQVVLGEAARWRILDLGTGNGLMLHELARHGFVDLTGSDYSEAAVQLATDVALAEGVPHLKFVVDDLLDTRLEGGFDMITDKGTFDAVRLHPDGRQLRELYKRSVESLLTPGGFLVLTSCNSTKNELVRQLAVANRQGGAPGLEYIDHVRTYPTFKFGGIEGCRVCTVAFRKPMV